MTDIAVCVPVYRQHRPPNISTLGAELAPALDGLSGQLHVALNGVSASEVGVPSGAVVVDLGINRGVAPGWNAAAASSSADVLVFANDDVSLGPGSLAMLHHALAEHPEAGVVGPVGSRFDFGTGRHISWVDVAELPPGTLAACDVVSGFLFALRRRDFETIGGFDDAYAPATMEEVDLALAIRFRLGLETFVVAGVSHVHTFGISSTPAWRLIKHNGRREFLFAVHRRNRRHFFRKWAGQL